MDLTERGDGVGRHPWEVQRFEAYRRVLADHGALSARRVLDVGAGDGWFSESLVSILPAAAEVVCWDIHYDDNDLEPQGDRLVRTRETPQPGFDLVLALDVLEHVEDAASFVDETLAPLTNRGTRVLVAVPAYQRLFGSHDVALGHHRRYSRRLLHDQLRPWIEIVDHGSLFTSLLLPRAATIAVERLRGTDGDAAGEHGVGGWDRGRFPTALVNGALAADARLGRALGRRGVPIPGLSLWAFGVTR